MYYLQLNDQLKTCPLFLITELRHGIKNCFGYANGAIPERVMRKNILLPVNATGEIDCDYMAEYIRSHLNTMLCKYKAYINKQISKLTYKEIPKLDEKEWLAVNIVDLFKLIRGNEANMAMLPHGNIPLISAKNANNGLKGFVGNSKQIMLGHCITLNNDGDGGAGIAYYQPADMALDTHVTALYPKRAMSKWVMLFIAKCLSGLHGFFGHGLSISNKRAKTIRIMLPITKNMELDFDYMEQYAKNLMCKKYQQYLTYLESKEKNRI